MRGARLPSPRLPAATVNRDSCTCPCAGSASQQGPRRKGPDPKAMHALSSYAPYSCSRQGLSEPCDWGLRSANSGISRICRVGGIFLFFLAEQRAKRQFSTVEIASKAGAARPSITIPRVLRGRAGAGSPARLSRAGQFLIRKRRAQALRRHTVVRLSGEPAEVAGEPRAFGVSPAGASEPRGGSNVTPPCATQGAGAGRKGASDAQSVV